jgi:hypothetical protein
MTPYGQLIQGTESDQTHKIAVSFEALKKILLPLISKITVDEDYYLERYEDVHDAIKNGQISSAKEHYVNYGYFENRLPRLFQVEEHWYLARYQDVRNAINEGKWESGQDHFNTVGYTEGRYPSPNWEL